MTNVDIFIDELGKLPHDNGSKLNWYFDTDYELMRITILIRDKTQKPVKALKRMLLFEEIMAAQDPRGLAAMVIEKMYYDFGEHIIDEKLLMSPDKAAGILREFTKDFEECSSWDIEDDVLITALKVAIKCLEVTL